MKAWLMHDYKGIHGLELRSDVDQPVPAEGEVLVRLRYAALNPADHFLSKKLYPVRPEFPHILGRDGSGTVEAVGPNVENFQPGQDVMLLRGDAGVTEWGTFAEYVTVPADRLALVPDGWVAREAAAAALVYQTAHMALLQWGPLPEGSNVLITGASGGVGGAATHLAKAWGCRVLGTTRNPAKVDELRANGVDDVLLLGEVDVVKYVREATGSARIARVVDNVGGELFNQVVDTMGYGGCISVIGMLGGPVPKFNTAKLLFKRVRIGGVAVSDYTTEEAHKAWGEIQEALARIGKKPLIDRVFPFEDLPAAFDHLNKGPMGKVLVEVS
ncbi:zinc-binding alcohol dehydrogenase family protein [bacterium]|nr:zinc-binding alcohol dehydrogenase family protein [bacterium]